MAARRLALLTAAALMFTSLASPALAAKKGQGQGRDQGEAGSTELVVPAGLAPLPGGRKLIEVGWGGPHLRQIERKLPELEKLPFDGFAFRVDPRDHLYSFDGEPWPARRLQAPLMAKTDWGRFTDVFAMMHVADVDGMDWLDEGRWQTILGNMRLLSQAIGGSQVKGIVWEPEFHYESQAPWIWAYDADRYPDHSFAEMEALLRSRGAQFMEALQSSDPDMKVFSQHLGSMAAWRTGLDRSKLSGTVEALFPAFFEGMLEAAGDQVQLIDGHKRAYWHDDSMKYPEGYAYVHDDVKSFMDPAVAADYDAHVRIAEPIFVNHIFGMTPFSPTYDSAYNLNWLEHNTYQALLTTDEYAWTFTKVSDWWVDYEIPDGAAEALMRARQKFAAGDALGWDMVKPSGAYETFVRADVVTGPAVRIATPTFGETTSGSLEIEVRAASDVGIRVYLDSLEIATGSGTEMMVRLENLSPGDHWIVARSFAPDGTHMTSNPVLVHVA